MLAVLILLAADARYGVEADTKAFPQSTPKEALASVLKAIEAKKFSYLVAHLAEQGFIDDRVKRVYGGKFSEQVDDTRARLDAFATRQLARLLKDGKWTEGKEEASVASEDVPDRTAHFVRKDGRWFLMHRFGR